jgi:hypothetical protein
LPLLSALDGPSVAPGVSWARRMKFAAVQRKILHRALVNEHRDRRRLRLQQRCLPGDGEMFFDRTDLELQAEAKAVADGPA